MALPTINVDIKSETVSKAIGLIAKAGYVLYEPYRIKKKATAESEAKIISTKTEIRISSLQRQALNRILSTETLRQENINNLTGKALNEIVSNGKQIDNATDVDWIKKYFGFSQDISNDEMQDIWSKILSGELTKSGSFSYKTMAILANMRKEEAALFSVVCQYVIRVGQRLVPLIYEDVGDKIDSGYNEGTLSFENLQFLQSLGLIHFNEVGEYILSSPSKGIVVGCSEKKFLISSEVDGKNVLKVGKVFLTKEGQELCTIINEKSSLNLPEIIKNRLVTENKTIKEL
jgi:hypothetical protein